MSLIQQSDKKRSLLPNDISFSKKSIINLQIKPYKSPLKKRKFNPEIIDISDRFIPISISPNYKCDDNEISPSPNRKNTDLNIPLTQNKNYQRILLNDLIGDSSKSDIQTNNIFNNMLLQNISFSKRKIKFKPNKNNSKHSLSASPFSKSSKSDSEDNLKSYKLLSKRKKTIKPFKQLSFNNPLDNFYFNILDIYDLSKIAIGTKDNLLIINADTYLKKEKIIKIDTRNFMYSLINNSQIYSVKFIDENLILTSNSQGELTITDIEKKVNIPILFNYNHSILTFDFYDDLVFFGNDSGKICSLDFRENHINNNNIINLYSHTESTEICKVKFSEKNKIILSGGNDDHCFLFDIREDKVIKKIKHNAAIKGIAFNNNETEFITGGGINDKTIKLFDFKKLNLKSEKLCNSQITNLEFINNNFIVSSFGYNDNMMVLYKINYDKIIKESISPMKLYNLDIQNQDKVIDILEEEKLFEKHIKRILYMAKDINDKYIVSASCDGILNIWDLSKYSNKDKSDFNIQIMNQIR